jgi:CRISPR-associated endonuclease/helicase Cas3
LGAADELLEMRLEASLDAVGLDREAWTDRLRKIVRLAAFVHDLGKANNHFQLAVRHQRDVQQVMRHEAVSLWLCWPGQALAAWLRPAVDTDSDYQCALIAAAGHHRKFWSRAFAEDASGAGVELLILTSHDDFKNTLNVGSRLGLQAPPTFNTDLIVRFTRNAPPRHQFSAWELSSDAFKRGDLARVLGVAKALVLAADVAGSSLPRSGEQNGWISRQLAAHSTAGAVGDLAARRLRGQPPRQFQLAVAEATAPVTLVRAGCGSGKTIAAYLWAKTQHPERKLWVTYPTTGTATEGFRDYLFGADLEARLEHTKAQIDIEVFGLADGAGEARERDRLDALRAWGCDAIACTVDTVLGLIQNHRKSLYAWPALAGACVVFDEIHAYDDSLFDALVHFLEAFPGIPILLMTASLPEARLERLRDTVRRAHPQELRVIDGPEPLETLARYRLVPADDPGGW